MKDKIVTITLSIILFLVPVLIVPSQWCGYNILKIVILLICGFILLITTTIRIGKLKFDKTDILILIFGLLAILSTIFSLDPRKSIIGEKNRCEGLLTIITYILIYYNAKYYFRNYKNFIKIGSIIYILIFTFAIVQFYAPTNIRLAPIFGLNANGTFGNTNFMGSFISLVLPAFILGYIFRNKKLYLIGSMVGFCSLVMCTTRSALVSFAIYMLISIVYIIINKNKKYIKRLGIIIIGFIICFTIINAIEKIKGTEINRISRKIEVTENEIKEIVKNGIKDKNASGRIGIWKNTIEIAYHLPILGCGVDALRNGIEKICPEITAYYSINYNSYIDKAHNEYLQIAATMGIPALIVYLTFIGTIVINGIRKMFKHKIIAIYTIVIISYLAQAFFNISTIGVAPIFWFILGITSSKIGKNKEKSLTNKGKI